MVDVIDVKQKQAQSSPPKKKKSGNKNSLVIGVLGLLLVAALGAAFYFWQDAQEAKEDSPEQVAARNEEESASVLTNLDAILLTESDTEPTVARVEEPQVLRDANPDFYKNVEQGDHLVLYPQRAIIYRSSEDRIINIAPIIDTSQLAQPEPVEDDQASDEETP